MSKIVVIAKIPCQPGKRDEAAAGLQPMLDHVENEEGTLEYLLLKDSTDEDVLWMYEVYADQASFDAHAGSEAMKSLGHALGGVLAGRPELIFTTPVGGKGL
ncbi:MAG: antibiotic biosynthesis monooxygenase [Ilumatobacter sp.]|jgi:quinol monooxygenase YgiN|nr:MAG: antibiotic biosynthesis monooxygenase [Ilumatobacter sp.]